MDASAIRAVAGHAHTTRGATNTKRRRLAHHAQLGKLTRIAPGYYLDTAAITAHPDPGTVVAIARLTAIQNKHPHLITSGRRHGCSACRFWKRIRSTSRRYRTNTRVRLTFPKSTRVHYIFRPWLCAPTGLTVDGPPR